MTSEEGEREESGSSLFEGMLLFSPSDLSPPPPPPPPPPAVPLLPLDEDLFSDLTLLQTLPDDPHRSTPNSTSASPPQPSRQVSRKKKRALRFGYATRESGPPPPVPATVIGITSTLAEEPLSCIDIDADSPQRNRPDDDAPPLFPPAYRELLDKFGEDEREDASPNPILEEDMDHPVDEETSTAGIASEKDDDDDFSSIEGNLKLIRARISNKLHQIRETAASVSMERKELGRRQRRAAESMNSVSVRYKELEKELEEACEAEDFVRAERVSESLAAMEKEKEAFLSTLRDAEADCDFVDSKMQVVLELQIEAEEEGVSLLENFAKDAADNADVVLKNAEEHSSKEIEEWQSSMEGLEIKKLELDVESHLINEARSRLEHSLEHLVEDDRKEKDTLSRKGKVLAKELGELLALVRLKEAEISENDTEIQEVEERISNVVSEFHETQSSINMKYDDLQSALSRIESENEALLLKKEELNEFISLTEHKRSKLRELASVSADEARTCQDLVGLRKSLAFSISKSRDNKVRLAKMEEKILEDIQILGQQVSAARTSLQELSTTRVSIQQEIASFKQRISFIDKRGPELEAEKKVAAAARNFKEAGRIAAEAKALNVEMESLDNKQEKALLDMEKLEKEINDTVDKIQKSEELIWSKEKEAATARQERLRLVAAAARAERSAALEMGDFEEGNILLQEAEAAESKARELQEAYDLESEILETTSDHFVSISFITNLAGQRLTEMASSFNLPATSKTQLH